MSLNFHTIPWKLYGIDTIAGSILKFNLYLSLYGFYSDILSFLLFSNNLLTEQSLLPNGIPPQVNCITLIAFYLIVRATCPCLHFIYHHCTLT